MKKRIVALVSALTLVFAMSMNVAAANSITASQATEISNAAGDVTTFPTSQEAMNESAKVADELLETSTVEVAPLTDAASAKALATEAAAELAKDDVENVEVTAVFELSGTAGDVTFKLSVNDNQKAYALHKTATGVEKILGTVVEGKVTFKFSSFSPVAIIIVTEKAAAPATNNQPAYNPNWDPTSPSYIGNTNASAPAPGAVVAPVAPKTGDVVMMVSIMAVIFMAGAAVAVAMSKKRA